MSGYEPLLRGEALDGPLTTPYLTAANNIYAHASEEEYKICIQLPHELFGLGLALPEFEAIFFGSLPWDYGLGV